MAGDYHSVLDGLILVLTIVFWNFFMDWLTLHSRSVEKLTFPDPVPLFQNRKMNRRTMSKQFVTENQLLSMLREHGLDDLSKVKAVFIEGSGHVSVIPVKDSEGEPHPDDRRERQAS